MVGTTIKQLKKRRRANASTAERVAFDETYAVAAEAVGHLADAFRCLGSHDDATQAADAAIKSQRRVEHAYRPAMSALLQVSDSREVTSRREI
jgi:hypothetical protein